MRNCETRSAVNDNILPDSVDLDIVRDPKGPAILSAKIVLHYTCPGCHERTDSSYPYVPGVVDYTGNIIAQLLRDGTIPVNITQTVGNLADQSTLTEGAATKSSIQDYQPQPLWTNSKN